MSAAEIACSKYTAGKENLNDAEPTNKHTHTLLLPLQAHDVTGRDVFVSVCTLVCICVLLRSVL